MVQSFVLLQIKLSNLSQGFIICVAVLVGLLFLYAIWMITRLAGNRKILKTSVKITEINEEKTKTDPRDYYRDLKYKNRFINTLDEKLAIRIDKSSTNNKDKKIFSSSLPTRLGSDNPNLRAAVPEIEDFSILSDHQIEIAKSSASRWSDIQDVVLKFLFMHLYKMYEWKYKKQIVFMSKEYHNGELQFDVRVEIKYHLTLIYQLCSIPGVINKDLVNYSYIFSANQHNFSLEKAEAFTWDELIPQIKKVFEDYFIGGLDFRDCRADNACMQNPIFEAYERENIKK